MVLEPDLELALKDTDMTPKNRRVDECLKFPVIQRRDIEISRLSIATRAYGIWLQQGRPIDQDVANWLQAESELKWAAICDDEVKHKVDGRDLVTRDAAYTGPTSVFI